MPETTVAQLDDTTENFAVYKCGDDNPVTGTYVTKEAAERIGDSDGIPEFVEFIVGGDQGLTLSRHDESTNYGQFRNMPYVKNSYVAKSLLSDLGVEGAEEITVALSQSTEEAFNEENGVQEDDLDEFIWEDSDDSEEENNDEEEALEELIEG